MTLVAILVPARLPAARAHTGAFDRGRDGAIGHVPRVVGDRHPPVQDIEREAVLAACRKKRINLRAFADGALGIALDEATTQADVDATVGYLEKQGVAALFETPRHRPDFATSETDTYYQVMFESPDGVLFEVVYTGPKG